MVWRFYGGFKVVLGDWRWLKGGRKLSHTNFKAPHKRTDLIDKRGSISQSVVGDDRGPRSMMSKNKPPPKKKVSINQNKSNSMIHNFENFVISILQRQEEKEEKITQIQMTNGEMTNRFRGEHAIERRTI